VQISFTGPTFLSDADEEQFFAWLYSLPGYEAIVGTGDTLQLTIADPVDRESVRELLSLFRRWRIDIAALLPLKSPENSDLALWVDHASS
jgi:hypothetical protein